MKVNSITVDHIGDDYAAVAVQIQHDSGELETNEYEVDKSFGEYLSKFLDQIVEGQQAKKEEGPSSVADADRQG